MLHHLRLGRQVQKVENRSAALFILRERNDTLPKVARKCKQQVGAIVDAYSKICQIVFE